MGLAENDLAAVNERLAPWRQGDVTLDAGLIFDLTRPHSSVSSEAATTLSVAGEPVDATPAAVSDEAIAGLVVLTQTCDIVRDCRQRPYVEVAPLTQVSDEIFRAIQLLRRPAFACIPGVADKKLVADLDRVMTVEKAVVAGWMRVDGCRTDDERRAFARTLRRKLARFAFPNDFVAAAQTMQKRILERHAKQSGFASSSGDSCKGCPKLDRREGLTHILVHQRLGTEASKDYRLAWVGRKVGYSV